MSPLWFGQDDMEHRHTIGIKAQSHQTQAGWSKRRMLCDIGLDGSTAGQSACVPEHRVGATKNSDKRIMCLVPQTCRGENFATWCDLCHVAHQTHVHSWEAANWRSQYAWYSIEAGSEGNTTKPTVYQWRSFQNREEVRWRSGKGLSCLGKDFHYLENPVRARFAHQNERHLFHRSRRWRIQRNHQKMQGESWKFRWTRNAVQERAKSPSRFQHTAAKSGCIHKILKIKYVCIVKLLIHQTTFGIISTRKITKITSQAKNTVRWPNKTWYTNLVPCLKR